MTIKVERNCYSLPSSNVNGPNNLNFVSIINGVFYHMVDNTKIFKNYFKIVF